ncbi:prepilin-type N-terminal cleavage/methylation domain-containing protein [Microbacterium sp. PRC9]|uniref:type IV pilus modification PilV family protein n=1 Tax=Microbacterium sp. PRC9 TaxID=2962591 RepID=UPI0028815B85|nr:prepilin-type N-terminal cleavage/methylation domain-containing protein [Microbacterium sp. PRC9]MDT0143886.1 prepilin-type N-terminal cleavage/methylation domain-containing protein [Microbacterium sp. PRC9]
MIRVRSADASGFSLIEVVIAMVILGFIAIALLPVLISGIRYSTEQADVASATRELNGMVERARATPTCGTLTSVAAPTKFLEGTVVTTGRYDYESKDAGFLCVAGGLNHLELTATTPSGKVLMTVAAEINVGT